jgi:hypothetical protein
MSYLVSTGEILSLYGMLGIELDLETARYGQQQTGQFAQVFFSDSFHPL